MTAEEYRALLDVDFNNVKIEDLTDIRKSIILIPTIL